MIISFLKSMQRKSGQNGATLIAVIVTMLVMAVIGAAIYSLTYTAALNQVVAQRAAKAFYLAESGLRIAASEYKAATDKNAMMVALHGKTFTLPDTISQITIEVFPYWLYADAAIATTLYLPGGAPPDDTGTTAITLPSSGLLRIKDEDRPTPWEGSTKTAAYSSAAIESFDPAKGTMVRFTFSTPFSDPIIPGDEFYIGYTYTDPALLADVYPGDDLVLNIDDDNKGTMFPPEKGIILVVISTATVSQYTYDTRTVNTSPSPHQVIFTNIQAVAGAHSEWPLTINNEGREIYIGKSVGFRSAAEYGD